MTRSVCGRCLRWNLGLVALGLAVPGLTGGCPDVRNGTVDALQAATIVALTDQSQADAVTTFQNGLMRSLVAVFFDHLRIQRVQQ